MYKVTAVVQVGTLHFGGGGGGRGSDIIILNYFMYEYKKYILKSLQVVKNIKSNHFVYIYFG